MSKGIATQTILLMLVGILVVGILIYIVYRTLMNPSLSEEECRARWISMCNVCKTSNWDPVVKVPSQLYDTVNGCAKPDTIFKDWKDNTCCSNDCGFMKDDCTRFGIG